MLLGQRGVDVDVIGGGSEARGAELGDFFRFTIEVVREDLAGPPQGGSRYRVAACLDGRRFIEFPLDITRLVVAFATGVRDERLMEQVLQDAVSRQDRTLRVSYPQGVVLFSDGEPSYERL